MAPGAAPPRRPRPAATLAATLALLCCAAAAAGTTAGGDARDCDSLLAAFRAFNTNEAVAPAHGTLLFFLHIPR